MLTLVEQAAPSAVASKVRVYYDSTAKRLKLVYPDGRIGDPNDADLWNYVRNSGFWFAQRQNPAAATNCGSTTLRAAGVLSGADGWGVWNENANTTYIRTDTSSSVETGLQNRYYGTFTKVTALGKFFVSQMIEGVECQSLRGRTVRVQVWAKADSARTLRLGLVQLANAGTVDTLPATFISAAGANGTDPTLGTNLSYVAPKAGQTGDNCTLNGNAYDCSVTTAWQRFSGVFDAPSNFKNLLVCFWSNAQVTATTGSFSLSQASLTDGYEIQDWTPMNYAVELQRVQRYFTKTFPVDTLPAQTGGVGNTLRGLVAIAGAVATSSCMEWRFPVKMRAAPGTVTFYNPSAANAFMRNIPAATDATATSAANTTEDRCDVNATGLAGWTVGQEIKVCAHADAAGTNNEFA